MKVPFVSFKVMEKELNTDIRNAFDRVFSNSWYIDGKEDKNKLTHEMKQIADFNSMDLEEFTNFNGIPLEKV